MLAKAFPRGRALVLFCSLLLSAAPEVSGADNSNPLFEVTTDQNKIKMQIQLALPALERGLKLLQSAPDPSESTKALDALFESYAYLRAAQESSVQVIQTSKFPDPMLAVRNERIWSIRAHLVKCRGAFTPDSQGIDMCTQEATAALQKLRVLLQVFP